MSYIATPWEPRKINSTFRIFFTKMVRRFNALMINYLQYFARVSTRKRKYFSFRFGASDQKDSSIGIHFPYITNS
jgi:hypothetical protein